MNNFVVVMGQLREFSSFKMELTKFQALKREGLLSAIYYVTDDGTLDEVTNEYLMDAGVIIVSKPALTDSDLKKFDPKIDTRVERLRKVSGGVRSGTVWRQLYDLNYVLKIIPQEGRILRTRTDIVLNVNLLRSLLIKPLPKSVSGPHAVLDEKIWVQWFSLHTPFYIHDTAFFGRAADLRKLVSEETNQELASYYPTASLPVFFWLLPFSKHSETISLWLRTYSAKKYSLKLLTDRRYLNSLLAYYKYINANFHVDYSDVGWYLQWNPGVMEYRIWDAWDPDRSIVDNLLMGYKGQRAVETDINLLDSIREFEQFVEAEQYRTVVFRVRIVFGYLRSYALRMIRFVKKV